MADYTIYVDSIVDKRLFFDFWRLPYSTDRTKAPNASIVLGSGLEKQHDNSVVLLPGDGEAQLCHLLHGIYLFAKVRRIQGCPEHLEVITPVFDQKERPISYILKDPKQETVYLPFSIDEVFENFYYEKYLDGKGKTFLPKPLMDLYYLAKPYLPNSLQVQARIHLAKLQGKRRFPRWPLETSLEDFKWFVLELLLGVSRTKRMPFLWFWPEGQEACLLLTHDVESGLRANGGIHRIISIEKSYGFQSIFNVVPFMYKVDHHLMNEIRSQGCEIGVHGYAHDAKLFSSYEAFRARIPAVNAIAQTWGAAGFRSCSTYRNPDWLSFLEFDYDCSFFDTDPYEPQPGGCLSFFPYFIGRLVEIPTTMPQDHTLFVLLGMKNTKIWQEKAQEIRKRNGLICLIAHPDEGYIGDEDKEQHYVEILDFFAGDDKLWNPLPRDVANWWRARHQAEIVIEGENMRIKNGTPSMVIRWATLVNGKLKFAENAKSQQ